MSGHIYFPDKLTHLVGFKCHAEAWEGLEVVAKQKGMSPGQAARELVLAALAQADQPSGKQPGRTRRKLLARSDA